MISQTAKIVHRRHLQAIFSKQDYYLSPGSVKGIHMQIDAIRKVAGIVCSMALAFTSASLMAERPYHIQDRWKVGGESGWDYLTVDPQSGLLYITRGNHVMAV